MKWITRMLIFSAVAIFITSVWNKGFSIPVDIKAYMMCTILVALLYYIVRPVTKIFLLPLNFISFGLVSVVLYSFLFYIVLTKLHLVVIHGWNFDGLSLLGLTIPKMTISPVYNIALSSLSVSVIITLLEFFL